MSGATAIAVSFFAPLITGAMAAHVGLRASMLVSSGVFAAAAAIWLRLPETLVRPSGRLGQLHPRPSG